MDALTGNVTITNAATSDIIKLQGDVQSLYGLMMSKVGILYSTDGSAIGLSNLTYECYDGSGGSPTTVAGSLIGKSVLHLSATDVTAVGGPGDNRFIDAPGAHAVMGGLRDNWYDFQAGDGSLQITPSSRGDDRLEFGTGIDRSAVTYQADDETGNLTVNLNDGYDDSIVLLGNLYRDGGGSVDSRAFAISFSDGSAFGLNSRMAFTYGGLPGYIMHL